VRAAALLTALLLLAPETARRRTDSPLDHLPANVEVLTHFGERADISPDDRRVAFMAKSFGDAFVIDLETRAIRCLTCNVPGAAFLRVMHLASGDYLLIGPDHFEDVQRSRARDNELWFLGQRPGSRPAKLGRKMSEGAAVSKRSTKIAYAVGIPVVGAILTRKFNPSLARGMVFGGLINGIVEAIKGYAPAETKKALGFAEYLDYTPMSALNGTPGYSAINQFSNVRPMNGAFSNSSAFPADAWGR